MKVCEYLAPWCADSTARVVVMDVGDGLMHELWPREIQGGSYWKMNRNRELVDIGQMTITSTWYQGNTLLIYARFMEEFVR